MDRVIRHAIAHGLAPMTAIQMATLNTAAHFGLERELGSITPGRLADIVITSDLVSLPIEIVIASGEIVAEAGRLTIELPAFAYPDMATGTVNLGRTLKSTDFDIHAPDGLGQVTVRTIGIIENQAPTLALDSILPVQDGLVQMDVTNDVCQIALVERHRGTGQITNGFVTGFGFAGNCAVASTVAHDSHHMIVVGTNKKNMAQAANRLAEVGGGIVVIRNGEEIALVELPIAGLMSNEQADIVARKADRMVEGFRRCGCKLNNAYMQLSLLALVVIPELRISDLGIVDVREFAIVPLFKN
jgi:adenine deaminase